MCGITGIINFNGFLSKESHQQVLTQMNNQLLHRGPDSDGIWLNQESLCGLGHRRLAIIDLSPGGHQPMISQNSRWIITFNGEIYNYQEIKNELKKNGVIFKSNSDTEVLVEAISHWGIKQTLIKLTGMFAFAIWDQEEKTLWLARDRLGERPLYYGKNKNLFYFASELKSLKKIPGLNREINYHAVSKYLRFNCIPQPETIYQDTFKLPPASFACVNAKNNWCPEIQKYWEPILSEKSEDLFNEEELAVQLENKLTDVIQKQMISDVPLGSFLSGGIDSSVVTCLMQKLSKQKIKSFSIGFSESNYDESKYARNIAKIIGTEHHEHIFSDKDALAIIPKLTKIYDEPFSDSSQLPSILLSQFARQHVTVCLSGDGGDEVFAGYNRYIFAPRLWSKIKLVPQPIRYLAYLILINSNRTLLEKIIRLFLKNKSPTLLHDKVEKLINALPYKDFNEFFISLLSHTQNPNQYLYNHTLDSTSVVEHAAHNDLVRFMQKTDLKLYLPEDILVKVDRAAMNSSLECRIPFLDHNIIEWSFSLPSRAHLNHGTGKILLRKILAKNGLKPELFERPKAGFAVPIHHWLRNELRPWAEDLLSHQKLLAYGILNPIKVRKVWSEHLSGKINHHHQLWDFLMLQSWSENEKES